MNKSQAGRLGGLTTAARGHRNHEAATRASLARFKNEAEKKLWYTRMALKRWGARAAPAETVDDELDGRVLRLSRRRIDPASDETAIRQSA